MIEPCYLNRKKRNQKKKKKITTFSLCKESNEYLF